MNVPKAQQDRSKEIIIEEPAVRKLQRKEGPEKEAKEEKGRDPRHRGQKDLRAGQRDAKKRRSLTLGSSDERGGCEKGLKIDAAGRCKKKKSGIRGLGEKVHLNKFPSKVACHQWKGKNRKTLKNRSS